MRVRIQLTLDPVALDLIDAAAALEGISRSAYLSAAGVQRALLNGGLELALRAARARRVRPPG